MTTTTLARDPVSQAGALLYRVFRVLDEAEIRYCVMHGYEGFPHRIGSDVDLLVPPDVLPDRLARVLHERAADIGARIVQWVGGAAQFIVLAGRGADDRPLFLHLHVASDYHLRRVTYFTADEVLADRRRRDDAFWVPSPAIEFACLLARRIDKGTLAVAHARRLTLLFAQDADACRRHVERLLGSGRAAAVVLESAESGHWRAVRRRMRRLRLVQRQRAARRRPMTLVRNCLAGGARALRRAYQADQGLSVVFLGPDGSGKSSVLLRARDDLRGAFSGTRRRSFPPGLLRRRAGQTNSDPHGQPPRSALESLIRAALYWLPHQMLDCQLLIRLAMVQRRLVVHDRHLFDVLVDPRRYRYGGPMWALRWICRLVPAPDLVVLLDAPPEVIQARKREVPLEETARQRASYLVLVSSLPNGHVLDASQPLDDVCTRTNELILSHLARRTGRRLGLTVPREAGT